MKHSIGKGEGKGSIKRPNHVLRDAYKQNKYIGSGRIALKSRYLAILFRDD
jgi:hypothetical protein